MAKFFFIVQGEGRGHMTQALALKDILSGAGHQVVRVLAGTSSRRKLPSFFVEKAGAPVDTFESPNFLADKTGRGIRVLPSVVHALRRFPAYLRSARFLRQEVDKYRPDAIINFFEPLTGLAQTLRGFPCPVVSIAHQYIYLHPGFQWPPVNALQRQSLVNFTRITGAGSALKLAISMYPVEGKANRLEVVPPLLRKELFEQQPKDNGYFLTYLLNAGYLEEVTQWHRQHPEIPLEVFTDKAGLQDFEQVSPTMRVHQLHDTKFLQMMAGCRGLATTAGFESVCEAMYLKKPVFMVPVAGHFEQMCNAIDAQRIGAGIWAEKFEIGPFIEYASQARPINQDYQEWVSMAGPLYLKHIESCITPKLSRP